MSQFPKLAQLKTVDRFRARLAELGIEIPVDDQIKSALQGSPLAKPIQIGTKGVGNRWCIHPMEGWDANHDGSPTELTLRRWMRFGESGAKLIWGGEAAAVRPDGRANPRQTMAIRSNLGGLVSLRSTLVDAHRSRYGDGSDLLIGLQLTHSGRFCKPNDSKRWESRILYHHPLLDPKFGIDPKDDRPLFTDEELETLMDDYVASARLAAEAGYDFVDVKACHGYLLHESLSAYTRPGPFGGDYTGRTRLLKTIIARIQQQVPGLMIGVRLSFFDQPPFGPSENGGVPLPYQSHLPYRYAFGCDHSNPLLPCLDEPLRLLGELQELGVVAVNLTAASPYYNPHLQRPAIFPPSDGYQPPEDPLVGVARQMELARRCKQAHPTLPLVGSAYTYLQEYLPLVAQAAVREGWIDIVGLGRMVLSYPELPADALAGNAMARKLVCRTFSECTTAPRQGEVSGCYPLDPYYKARKPASLKSDSLKSDST